MRDLPRAYAEATWYVSVNNKDPRHPRLSLGGVYERTPHIVGTNPYYAGQYIVSTMTVNGVISWWAADKGNITIPLPRYVYEQDKDSKTIQKRELSAVPVYAFECRLPNILAKSPGDMVQLDGKTAVIFGFAIVAGVTVVILTGGAGGGLILAAL